MNARTIEGNKEIYEVSDEDFWILEMSFQIARVWLKRKIK